MHTTATEVPPAGRQPAPGSLRIVQRLVNTLDVETGEDDLADPAHLRAWLVDADLIDPNDHVDQAARERLKSVREAFREILGAHTGASVDPAAEALLQREMCTLEVKIDAGGVRLVPAGEGVDRAVAALLSAVAEASLTGTWRRLKVCREHTCRFAFYDHSKNGSGCWCDMAVCGNRAKARRYRERARGAVPS